MLGLCVGAMLAGSSCRCDDLATDAASQDVASATSAPPEPARSSATSTAAASGSVPNDGELHDASPVPVLDPAERLPRSAAPVLEGEALAQLVPAGAGVVLSAKGPSTPNQGNPQLAVAAISREACLHGLSDLGIDENTDRAQCGGHPFMARLPSELLGDEPVCIDRFEFPNRPCELPLVWVTAPQAEAICRAVGKQLCSQKAWQAACSYSGSGSARPYAYGHALDLRACNTDKPLAHASQRLAASLEDPIACDPTTAQSSWRTCPTETEPAGSFPDCRSVLGVFDQHGNAAEIMLREEAGTTFVQPKGSAWYYAELATEDTTRDPSTGRHPDHCGFDPRWHVEPLVSSDHVAGHLGFRCCYAVPRDGSSHE